MDVSIEHEAAWYFELVASQSQMISKALALSLENSVQISICMADTQFVTFLGNTRPPIRAINVGDIVYTCRSPEGEAQIAQVVDRITRQAKFSAFASARA